MNRFTGYCSRN